MSKWNEPERARSGGFENRVHSIATGKPRGRAVVAVIGAGFSGTVTAINLLRLKRNADIEIVLIERQPHFGRGLAYRTWDDNFLLNVPAGNMSAFPDMPHDFVDYCRSIDPACTAASFMPRRLYGEYLEHKLALAAASATHALRRLHAEAVALKPCPPGTPHEITLRDGRKLAADCVVLALGHAPPCPLPFAVPASQTEVLIDNPWDFERIDRLPASAPVLLLGTGHTAVDVLLRLTRNDRQGKVLMLSRHGLLPKDHRFMPRPPGTGAYPDYLPSPPATIRDCVSALRVEVARRDNNGIDWRDVLNELRPHVPAIWQGLNIAERQRFLRHVLPYWDIHRHRLAPASSFRVKRMLAQGQIDVIAGRLLGVRASGAGFDVVVRPRHADMARTLTVSGIVNCTGPNGDLATATHPLLASLRSIGLVRADTLRLGLDTDDEYRIVTRDGSSVANIHYLGPMLKAHRWEAIAVPELRVHSHHLAQLILQGLTGTRKTIEARTKKPDLEKMARPV